jgi:hypothetical protein
MILARARCGQPNCRGDALFPLVGWLVIVAIAVAVLAYIWFWVRNRRRQ